MKNQIDFLRLGLSHEQETELVMKHAFSAIVDENGYSIGRADEGTRGYTPQPDFGAFPSWDAAKAKADELNKEFGLSEQEVARIVLGTMSGNGTRRAV
jgi:hypothetical protein